MTHPGRAGGVRIDHAVASSEVRHFRLQLPPGSSIYDAIVGLLAREGVRSASMTLLDGELSGLQYCVAAPSEGKHVVVAYSAPRVEVGARLIFGNATLGRDEAGVPVVHSHAVFRLGTGIVRGGHMLTERTTVGSTPITVVATALTGVQLQITEDAETGMPLMRPIPEAEHG